MRVAHPTRPAAVRGLYPLRFLAAGMAVGCLFAADLGEPASVSSPASVNFDAGLNRLRETKSGPAGVQTSAEPEPATKRALSGRVQPAPAPAPVAKPSPSVAVQTSAASTAIGLQGYDRRNLVLGFAALVLVAGLWIRWSQEGYRMDAEEAIKDNKMSADTVYRRVRVRSIAGHASIIGGLLLFVLALL